MAASPTRRLFWFLAMLVCAAQLAACGGGGGGGGGGSTTPTPTPTLASIAITPANSSISVGLNEQLRATGTYSDGSTQDLSSAATWTSANTSVGTINASGLATGMAAGTSLITASMSGVSGTTNLTITTAATLRSIAVTPANPSIVAGQTQQFTATGTYSDNSTQNVTSAVAWASATPGVATINAAGVASGVSAGSSTISAQLNGVTGATAWDNDLPKSDYFLWPDVFTSYSYAYVANQMNGAAIFHETGTPSNQHNNLVITWPGAAPSFQVWQ